MRNKQKQIPTQKNSGTQQHRSPDSHTGSFSSSQPGKNKQSDPVQSHSSARNSFGTKPATGLQDRARVKSLQTSLPPQMMTQRFSHHARHQTIGPYPSFTEPDLPFARKRFSGSQSVGAKPTLLSNSKCETHIKLLIRIRPPLGTENSERCIKVTEDSQAIPDQPTAAKKEQQDQEESKEQNLSKMIKLTKGYSQAGFKFDQVLDEQSTQSQMYNACVYGIVDNFLMLGTSATILAYGQTGAGKTYTIMGGTTKKGNMKKLSLSKNEKRGILPRIIDQLFQGTDSNGQPSQTERQFQISFYEIYNDKVHDLLKAPAMPPSQVSTPSSNTLELSGSPGLKRESLSIKMENGNFFVNGLSKKLVNAKQEAYIWLDKGIQNRRLASTVNNAYSSRSHTIFQIETYSPYGANGQFSSKLRIVDLAGSEKFSRNNKNQEIKKTEQTSINLSLSALGKCISALGDKKAHIPFRDSKLTRILKDSLMQPSDTCLQTVVALVICISPSTDSHQETHSTLLFANGAKKAILNQSPMISSASMKGSKSNQLQSAMNEIDKLRKENSQLKNQVSNFHRALRQSNSQGSMQILPLDGVSPIDQCLDSGRNQDSNHLHLIDLRMSLGKSDGISRIIEQQESPIKELSVTDFNQQSAEPKIQLRSCFKGERASKNPAVQVKVQKARVIFNQALLDNNTSLDSALVERVEHNLRYNDDTIFDGLSIFQDVNTYKKVHGAKDKFDAGKLLRTPIEEIPVSDEEENNQKQIEEQNSSPSYSITSQPRQDIDNNLKEKPILQDSLEESKDEVPQPEIETQRQAQNQEELCTSFVPDLPSIHVVNEGQHQETLNFSNDISQDFVVFDHEKQFGFKDGKKAVIKKIPENPYENGKNSKEHSEGSFIKFGDDLPMASIPPYNQEQITKQEPSIIRGDQGSKAQEKSFFQADLSNIIGYEERDERVEFTANNIIIEGENEIDDQQSGSHPSHNGMGQQQSTLIFDEEEVGAPITKSNRRMTQQNRAIAQASRFGEEQKLPRRSMNNQMTQDFDTGNVSGNITSFDASRISPDNANNLMASQKGNGFEKIFGQLNTWSEAQEQIEKQEIKPELFQPMEIDFGKQSGRNHQQINMEFSPKVQVQREEILASSLQNTFSTITSLEGELSALRRMSNRQTFDKKKKHNIKSTVVRDFTERLDNAESTPVGSQQPKESGFLKITDLQKHSSSSLEPKPKRQTISKQALYQHKQLINNQEIEELHSIKQRSLDEENVVITDQSVSVDIATISRDLQTYYSKIHTQIAQLKDVLVKSQQKDLRSSHQTPLAKQMSAPKSSLQSRSKNQLRSADSKITKQFLNDKNTPLISDLDNKSINVNAINRTQDLINLIKTAILSSISEKEQSTPDNRNESQELSFQLNEQKILADIERESAAHKSQNVVELLQELQGELLDSIPQQNYHERPTQSRNMKRGDISLRFEEIEGSQERSPYAVRHLHVQRQNWIKLEEAKGFMRNSQSSLPRFNEDEISDQAITTSKLPAQATRLCGTPELMKKVLSDSTVLNVTNTSAVIGDQSSQYIQQPHTSKYRLQKDLYKHSRSNTNDKILVGPLLQEHTPEKLKSSKEPKQTQHGPKMLGVGQGALPQDHTLTLIFDSDDEQNIDNSINQTASKQKRLSEIVEDYFNEGGYTPNQRHENKKPSKFTSGSKSGIGGSQLEDVFVVARHEGKSNRDSFMQENSVLNLFSGNNENPGDAYRNSFADTSNGGKLLGSFALAPENFNLKKELEKELFFENQDRSTEKGRRSISNQNVYRQSSFKNQEQLRFKESQRQKQSDNMMQEFVGSKPEEKDGEQEETKQTKILPKQKWAPPPKLKSLKKKQRDQKGVQNVGMLFQPPQPEARQSNPSIDNENIRMTHDQLSFEERMEPQPSNLLNLPGSHVKIIEANPIPIKPTPAAVLVRKQTNDLNQNEISRYSENFEEDEHQELTGSTSTKHSVQKYLKQIFPSAKLHKQKQGTEEGQKIHPQAGIAGRPKSSKQKSALNSERRRDQAIGLQDNKQSLDRISQQAKIIKNIQNTGSQEKKRKVTSNPPS